MASFNSLFALTVRLICSGLQNIDDAQNWVKELAFSEETQDNQAKEVQFYVRKASEIEQQNNIAINEISKLAKESYQKDTTIPQGSINVGTDSWKEFLNNATFGQFFKDTQKIEILAQDNNSGINSIKYFKSADHLKKQEIVDLPGESWTQGSSFNATPDDKFIVYAQIIDNAGNTLYISSEGVVINATAPSISISSEISENFWTNKGDAKFDVVVSHTLPVIDNISYKIGTGEVTNVDLTNFVKDSNEAPDSVEFSIQNIPDGEYDIVITACAKLGICTEKTFSVKKDTVAPIISEVSLFPDTIVNTDVTVTIDVHDEASGLAPEAYSFDAGDTWQSSMSKVYTKNTVIPENAIQVRDAAGNVAKHADKQTIDNIDKLKPNKPYIEGSSNDWKNTDITLKVVAQDIGSTDENTESGIAYFEYSLDGAQTFTKVNWSDNPTFTIKDEGDYTNKVCVKVTDNAGNTSDLSELYTAKIDRSSPEIVSVTGNAENWTNQNVILTVNAQVNGEKALSDLAQEAYSFDSGNTWQKSRDNVYTHNTVIPKDRIKVRNAAGNISSYSHEIVIDKIDKLKPQTPTIQGAPAGWTDKDVVLKVISNDLNSDSQYASSKIAYFEYSLDGANSFTKVDWSDNPTFTISKDGDYTNKIFVRTIDNAGNASDLSKPYTAKVNKSGNYMEVPFRKVDEKTGVIVTAGDGIIPKDSELIVYEVVTDTEMTAQEYEEAYANLDENVKSTMQRCKIYEIHFKNAQGEYVQPNGFVEVSIPIPDDFDKGSEDLDIYRIKAGLDDDDHFEKHISEIDGHYYCSFSTNHFSPYALVDKNTSSKSEISRQNRKIIAFVFILILIGLILLIIFLFRKKRDEH